MSKNIKVKRTAGGGKPTYVVEGATLMCTLGGKPSKLQIPAERGIFRNEKKEANIDDHVGGENILSFGPCSRSIPPPPCIMATSKQWIMGKNDVITDGHPALLSTSVNICDCGGVISIVDDGQ